MSYLIAGGMHEARMLAVVEERTLKFLWDSRQTLPNTAPGVQQPQKNQKRLIHALTAKPLGFDGAMFQHFPWNKLFSVKGNGR